MERKFKSHMVDVRGLSRKEAKEKRKRAYREFMLYRDLKEAYHADTCLLYTLTLPTNREV